MNFKVALTLLFTSVALAVPGNIHHVGNVLARDPQMDTRSPPAPSCCSLIPGLCQVSCCPGVCKALISSFRLLTNVF
ncbi:hypothetical protein CDEST_15234 [Colletotrichum destructivum]|uniref:Uncharacterized protein n=1 Tax=Colletotrichum destructivum TaxID=34406 RepID=A0AAX4J415_9PEZI|nr:hypothetical protein CDEST_15234 [Colletotrichum destructivum]